MLAGVSPPQFCGGVKRHRPAERWHRKIPRLHNDTRRLCFPLHGLHGEKAAQWKEEFIGAFNWQAEEIQRLRALHTSPDWHQARIEGKAARRIETDTIQMFVEYAKNQGSRSAGKYYLALTKAANRSLFFIQGAVGKNFRERLSAVQLASLAMAEHIVERALIEAMAGKVHYKAAYKLAADRVRQFAALVGQSVPRHSATLLPGAQ